MSSQNAVIKHKEQPAALTSFEGIAEKLNGLSVKLDVKPFARMFVLANAMNELRDALTEEVMAPIMSLQGTRVGFKTDKDLKRYKDSSGKWVSTKGDGYTIDVVRNVTMEAILYGAYMTGNEVNIISGQMYATKEHFVRKVRELEGLGELDVTIGTPVIEKDVAKVRCKAKWTMYGKEQSLGTDDNMPLVFSTRVYDREGGHSVASDQAIGKITRKLYKLIYETATGAKIHIPDGDADENAREVPASVVEKAAVDLADITPGDPATHTAVDATQPAPKKGKDSILGNGDKKRRDTAYSYLSAVYDDNLDIDTLLANHGQPGLQEIPKDTKDLDQIAALVAVARIIESRQEGNR